MAYSNLEARVAEDDEFAELQGSIVFEVVSEIELGLRYYLYEGHK
jgi:hypothetical protein